MRRGRRFRIARQDAAFPDPALEPRWLRYDEAGRFGTYVERFFEVIGRERCMVSVFDDLVADPEGQYRAMCDFLGLDPFAATDFSPRRESRGIRFGWLQRLLKRPPAFARDYLAGEKFGQRERALDKPPAERNFTKKIFSVRKKAYPLEPGSASEATDPARRSARHSRPLVAARSTISAHCSAAT